MDEHPTFAIKPTRITTPTPDMVRCLQFAQRVLYLCARYGASETSGYRTAKRNKAVGGHPASQHLLGLARDVVLDDPNNTTTFTREAITLGLDVLIETTHIHLTMSPGSNP